MKMWMCLGALAFAACQGETLKLGTGAEGGAGPDGAGSAASCSSEGGASTPSDGSGYSALTPPACIAADGPVQAITSVSQMARAVVGTWFDCGSGAILEALAGGLAKGTIQGVGIELTGDGHYAVLQANASTILSEPPRGPVTGTYDIVDASATLGPNTFQIRLKLLAGGVYLAQVVMLGSPLKMRFVYSTGPSLEEFAPALNLKFRAGVCTYSQFGPQRDFASAAETAAGIVGKWIWCGDGAMALGQSHDPAVGIEFPGDGAWYALIEDDSGNVTRGTDGSSHGTVTTDTGSLFLLEAAHDEGTIPVVAGACAPLLAFTYFETNGSGLPSTKLATFFQRSR